LVAFGAGKAEGNSCFRRAGQTGVRGEYAARYRAGTNILVFSPDVAEYFPDERYVNAALRGLIQVAKKRLRDAR
jgi:hypothetical protein